MSKIMNLFLSISCLAIVISGCGESEAIDSESDDILIMHYKETMVEGFNQINEAFNEYKGYDAVRQEMVATEYNTVLQSRIQVNAAPDVFVIGTVGERGLASYIENKTIADLSDMEILKNIPEDILQAIEFSDGNQYVIPFLNTARGIIYNTELFEKAGIKEPPKTLSELEDAAQKIQDIGVIPFGVAGAEGWSLGSIPWQVSQEHYFPDEWIEEMWAGNASFLDYGIPALDFFDLMLNYANKNIMDTDLTSQVQGLIDGDFAMIAQGPWIVDIINEISPEFTSNLKMMAIPVSEDEEDSKLYYDNDMYFVVSKDANLDLVDEYMMFIHSGQGREIFKDEVKILNSFGIEFPTDAVNQSIIEYISADNYIMNYQYNNMPDGFWQSNANVMQLYAMGSISKEEALLMLDDEWQQLKVQ